MLNLKICPKFLIARIFRKYDQGLSSEHSSFRDVLKTFYHKIILKFNDLSYKTSKKKLQKNKRIKKVITVLSN
jgi:hypothetical protein